LGLLVRIDHWNNYRTEYGHLSAVVAYTGRIIGAYDPYKKSHEQIGTSGNTGNSTGPHLHFEVQNLHNNVWKVVDPFGWSGGSGRDPWENNGGAPSVNLWVTAPRQYPPPGDGPVVIDDGNSGFTSSSGWNVVSTGGYNNDLRWKLSSVSQTAWAKWKPTVPIRTTYEVQAYIPAYPVNNELARTHAASYEIYNNGQRIRTVTVDQHRVGIRFDENGNISGRNSQWVSLGRYEFNAGSNSYVWLTNAAQFVCNNSDIQGCTLYSESGKYIRLYRK
jgi:murein DD-endopeptidase MepM/ murein hydrolase activator NlpD